MSTTNEVREFLRAHSGQKYSNAALRDELDTDDSQGVSVALNYMHNNKELHREKNPDGAGYLYWIGTEAPAASGARLVKGQASADDDEVKPPSASAAAKKILASRVPKQSRVAKTAKPKKEKKTKKAKRVDLQRGHAGAPAPDAPTPPAPTAANTDSAAPGVAVFGIRHDGKLVIDNDGQAVALAKPEVQRLQCFLNTVSPLWS